MNSLSNVLVEAGKDAARLEWIMNNPDKLITEFPLFVLRIGGTGGLNECREFADSYLKHKNCCDISGDLLEYVAVLRQCKKDQHECC